MNDVYLNRCIIIMGNRLCCESHVNSPTFNFDTSLETKVLGTLQMYADYLRSHPTISKLVSEEEAEGKMEGTIKDWKVEKIREVHMMDGTFIGDIKGEDRNGYGIMMGYDGCYYEGNWEDNMRHGKGLYADDNGELYHGEWERDEPSGMGKFKSSQPCVLYKGYWSGGMKNGEGVE